jgi:hypothetical protein
VLAVGESAGGDEDNEVGAGVGSGVGVGKGEGIVDLTVDPGKGVDVDKFISAPMKEISWCTLAPLECWFAEQLWQKIISQSCQ